VFALPRARCCQSTDLPPELFDDVILSPGSARDDWDVDMGDMDECLDIDVDDEFNVVIPVRGAAPAVFEVGCLQVCVRLCRQPQCGSCCNRDRMRCTPRPLSRCSGVTGSRRREVDLAHGSTTRMLFQAL
jgi:hypothetical protein